MAYLPRQNESEWVAARQSGPSDRVQRTHFDADLVAKAGWTSCGFRLSDQNRRRRSNFGSMSANWAFPSGKIRRRPPCSWKGRNKKKQPCYVYKWGQKCRKVKRDESKQTLVKLLQWPCFWMWLPLCSPILKGKYSGIGDNVPPPPPQQKTAHITHIKDTQIQPIGEVC